ncbi:hypothetical protein [Peribacillus simplex]|uniref:hypothetical protein n=1 Tax=Peribacillus simplex TaxID=1478 RepID=UPI003D293EF0
MNNTAFLFPGIAKSKYEDFQEFIKGSKYAQDLYQEASDLLGFPLLQNFANGDKSVVTDRCAYFVNTLSLLNELDEAKKVNPKYVIGSSFGITTAAVYLGSLNFVNAIHMVRETAIVEDNYLKAMDQEYGTHFIYKYSLPELKDLIEEFNSKGKWMEISVYISDDLIGIGASIDTIDELKKIIKVRGKSTSIHTAELSHTSNLKDLRKQLDEKVYSQYHFSNLNSPFLSDLDGRIITSGSDLKNEMLKSVDNPVKFTLVHERLLRDQIRDIYVIGPSNFFGAILKKDFSVRNVDPSKLKSLFEKEV